MKKSKSIDLVQSRVLDSNPNNWSKEDIVNVLLITILKDRPNIDVTEHFDSKGNKISVSYRFQTLLNKFNV